MKFKVTRKFFAVLLTFAFVLGLGVSAYNTRYDQAAVYPAADNTTPLTCGQARDIILASAGKYREGLKPADMMSGYRDGSLKAAQTITRLETLVMISRAFGELPEPKGDTLRKSPDPVEYTDMPEWAKDAIANLNKGRILVPTDPDERSESALPMAGESITAAELDILLHRIYALYGTRVEDDFYAVANKEWLDASILPEGRDTLTIIDVMRDQNGLQYTVMITNILQGKWEKGTEERKVTDFAGTITNMDVRNEIGYAPLKPYIDAIDAAANLNELDAAQAKISRELAYSPLFDFSINLDGSGDKYALYLKAPSDSHRPYDEAGEINSEIMAPYVACIAKLFAITGDETPEASAKSAIEITLMLDAAKNEYPDVDPAVAYTPAQLASLIPAADMKTIYAASGFQDTDSCLVPVPSERAYKALAKTYTEANLASVKAYLKYMLLEHYAETLSKDFIDALGEFAYAKAEDMEAADSAAQIAQNVIEGQLYKYFDYAYAKHYLPNEADMEILYMTYDFINYYKERIAELEWMSDTTKAMAIKKLDKMTVKVGRPVVEEDLVKLADIRGITDDGTYLGNMAAVAKAKRIQTARNQGKDFDIFTWDGLRSYDINAFYSPEWNQIMFPAGICQSPLYTYGAPIEQNLGGIGWIIAHEITHAFDVNGSKYDENGNEADWWTAADKAEFERLCGLLIAHYDGYEVAPGIKVSGELTLPENIADLGGLSCALAILEQRKENPDYQLFFTSVANALQSTMTRELAAAQVTGDFHSPDKARVNKTIQTVPEFYDAFAIKPGDGMYIPPDERVRIW